MRRIAKVGAATGWFALVLTSLVGTAGALEGDAVADAVLGQPNFTSSGCGQGSLGASSMCRPTDAAVDPASGRLYVAEDGNDRVTSWPSATSFVNGQAADLVLGQPNFTTNGCNSTGLGPASLCAPSGVSVDHQGNLYVADRGNSRVLLFSNPAATDQIADKVFGQASFTSNQCNAGGVSASSLCAARNVAVDTTDNLYVSDWRNNRVLIYLNPITGDSIADRVIGQAGFDTGKCARGRLGLCAMRGLDVDGADNLFLADSGNDRVLVYRDPLATDGAADEVLGQSSFRGGVCNAGGLDADSLCSPRDVGVDSFNRVFVADTSNSRVTGYNQPLTGDNVADIVLGQPSFFTRTCNNGGVTSTSMCLERGLGVDAAGNVYAADTENSRILRFDQPL
jgi:DNA-binding beta-propeller fold protein YncE